MVDDLEAALALVCRFVAARHPTAETALLAGSRARRQGVAGSDYDVVLLFEALPEGAWRETVLFEEKVLEVWAHDLGTLAYFCREVDRPSGRPVLPAMVADGIPASSGASPLLDRTRRIGRDTLQLGPTPFDAETLRLRRYAITDLAAALHAERSRSVLIATGAALHAALADFALRSADCWSASGKAVPRALAGLSPALADQFETAFDRLFAAGETGPVQALVDAVLRPHGGRLRDGFHRRAPASWRDAVPPGQPPP